VNNESSLKSVHKNEKKQTTVTVIEDQPTK